MVHSKSARSAHTITPVVGLEEPLIDVDEVVAFEEQEDHPAHRDEDEEGQRQERPEEVGGVRAELAWEGQRTDRGHDWRDDQQHERNAERPEGLDVERADRVRLERAAEVEGREQVEVEEVERVERLREQRRKLDAEVGSHRAEDLVERHDDPRLARLGRHLEVLVRDREAPLEGQLDVLRVDIAVAVDVEALDER